MIFAPFQYAPTNKLLYAKDIPKFKQEVKMYYKQIRDQSPVTPAEFKDFLHEESKVNPLSADAGKSRVLEIPAVN